MVVLVLIVIFFAILQVLAGLVSCVLLQKLVLRGCLRLLILAPVLRHCQVHVHVLTLLHVLAMIVIHS